MRIELPAGSTIEQISWDVETLRVLIQVRACLNSQRKVDECSAVCAHVAHGHASTVAHIVHHAKCERCGVMQDMLERCNTGPVDLMRAWDKNGDKCLSKAEWREHVRRFLEPPTPEPDDGQVMRGQATGDDGVTHPHPCSRLAEIWAGELLPIVEQAFEECSAAKRSLYTGRHITVVALQKWLQTPSTRPENRYARGVPSLNDRRTSRPMLSPCWLHSPPRAHACPGVCRSSPRAAWRQEPDLRSGSNLPYLPRRQEAEPRLPSQLPRLPPRRSDGLALAPLGRTGHRCHLGLRWRQREQRGQRQPSRPCAMCHAGGQTKSIRRQLQRRPSWPRRPRRSRPVALQPCRWQHRDPATPRRPPRPCGSLSGSRRNPRSPRSRNH